MSPSAPSPSPVTRREIFAWAMYDWANSAYSTLSIVVLVNYIKFIVLPGDSPAAQWLANFSARMGAPVKAEAWGATIWAWGLSIAMLAAALLSPIIGALADARATKRHWLAGTAFMGAALCSALHFVPAENAALVIALFVLSSFFFDLAFGIYNGFLPEVADETTMNRISSWGFALGYIGGGLALLLELLVLTYGEAIGVEGDAAQLRFGLLLMGVWWGVFTVPTVLILKDRTPPTHGRMPPWTAAKTALGNVRRTLANVGRFRTLALYLVGYLFFNEGVQTVINQSSVFATDALKFTTNELTVLILAFQFICFPGAVIVGRLADRIGQKATLMLCLAVWVSLLIIAYFIQEKWHFWLMAVALGIVMGGTQSVARAVMGMMTPARHTAEFFGFFNFSGRATSWLGSGIWGLIIASSADMQQAPRYAVLGLLPLFLIGWTLTALVDVARGRADALAADKSVA